MTDRLRELLDPSPAYDESEQTAADRVSLVRETLQEVVRIWYAPWQPGEPKWIERIEQLLAESEETK